MFEPLHVALIAKTSSVLENIVPECHYPILNNLDNLRTPSGETIKSDRSYDSAIDRIDEFCEASVYAIACCDARGILIKRAAGSTAMT